MTAFGNTDMGEDENKPDNESEEERPVVRPLEAIPVRQGERVSVLLKDPEGLSEEVLQVSREAFFVIALMDGNHTITDIQAEFARTFGTLIYSDDIKGLVRSLDEHKLLDNENYKEWRRSIEEEFVAASRRPAMYAGGAYPADGRDLRRMLDGFFAESDSKSEDTNGPPTAVVAPHISLERGRKSFALAYSALRSIRTPATVFLLGTCHMPMRRPFALTAKTFETPIGETESDAESVGRLKRAVPWICEAEFSHRREHSIEFQVLFLRYVFDDAPVRIVPILCGSFAEMMHAGGAPDSDPQVKEALDALGETVRSAENPVIIASADLSHVGSRFGDRVKVSDEFLNWLRGEDERTLEHVVRGDAEGFWRDIADEGDRRKICGLPPIWTLLKLLPEKASGTLLSYEQSPEPEANSVVTFAAVAWRQGNEEQKEAKGDDGR